MILINSYSYSQPQHHHDHLPMPFFLALSHLLLLLLITATTPATATNHNPPAPPTTCLQSCAGKRLPYPFGFSEGCPIRLNCTPPPNNTIILPNTSLPVHAVTHDSIIVALEAQCNGPLVHSLRRLYGPNFAPTSRNGLLLQNCSTPISTCQIPTTMVNTRFELSDCGGSSSGGGRKLSNNVSCYSERQGGFIDLGQVERSRCGSLFSSIWAEFNDSAVVSLEIQVVELGWWIQGRCDDGDSKCDPNANCTEIVSPLDGRSGFRCRCRDGFDGDGYRAGLGCGTAAISSRCDPSKYIFGHCAGITRLSVLIGGLAVGALLSLLGLAGLFYCLLSRRRYTRKSNKTTWRHLPEATDICIPMYQYKEVEKATNGFSDKNRIGIGAYGTVYSGKLHNDEWVAIKRIRDPNRDNIDQVINEIKLISSVSHPNLVRLLGCSIDDEEKILMFEYMPNGTLCQHLQGERGDGLAWQVRLKIVLETAQAIAHLHSAINPPIYHRDIKSSNILLDYDYKSKVADFGLSRLGLPESSHISTMPQGTPGYLDPQYHQYFHLSDKSDVYSFGVVLVEVITGLKVVDFSRPQNEVNLASLAVDRIGRGCVDEIIDPLLKAGMDGYTLFSIHKVAELAFRCLAFHKDMRPSMVEVAEELEQIKFSRQGSSSEDNDSAALLRAYLRTRSSDGDEKRSRSRTKKGGVQDGISAFMMQNGTYNCMSSMELEDDSSAHFQDLWSSEQSSPSSNGLLVSGIH